MVTSVCPRSKCAAPSGFPLQPSCGRLIAPPDNAWPAPWPHTHAPCTPCSPYQSVGSVLVYVMMLLVAIDICLNFHVARFKDGQLVTDRRQTTSKATFLSTSCQVRAAAA